MPRYIMTVKQGKTTISIACRDAETGETFSVTVAGPREVIERWVRMLEKIPEYSVKWE